jgi:hypothetical protein
MVVAFANVARMEFAQQKRCNYRGGSESAGKRKKRQQLKQQKEYRSKWTDEIDLILMVIRMRNEKIFCSVIAKEFRKINGE